VQRIVEESVKTTVNLRINDSLSYGQLNAYLRVIFPKDNQKRIRLDQQSLIIGRDEAADLVLESDQVSRSHCKVRINERGLVEVEDLESTNGTFIDDAVISKSYLSPSCRLQLGPYVIKLEYANIEEIREEEMLRMAATTDPLTGIANRKWFEEQVEKLLNCQSKPKRFVALVMADIDHFKQINDKYGHPTGDAVIQGVAQIFDTQKRRQDILARYGGEEFILCLPDCSIDDAVLFCDRVRDRIENTLFRFGKESLRATISLGVISKNKESTFDLKELISSADEALYQSKSTGRNKVSIFKN